LDGLTALVGENAGGKSTILEALEILRRTTEPGFVDALYNIHGGALGLFRDGTNELVLGARISDSPPACSVQYELVLAKRGHAVAIRSETIERVDETASRSIRSMERKGQDVQYDGNAGTSVRATDSVLAIPLGQAEARRLASCLGGIAVHMEFDVLTPWACHVAGRESALRGSTLLKPADRLELSGRNLASVYFKLRNEFDDAHWAQTMDYVRLGLGDQIASVNTRVDPAGGNVALELKLHAARP
jgi:predicted ATPase